MGFNDPKGYYRNAGEGFYDSKGYYRNAGEGFYDFKGYYRKSGEGFYDAKGYFRKPGEGFYDAKGYWVKLEESFYDGRYLPRTNRTESLMPATTIEQAIVAATGFILFLPIALLWGLIIFLVEWMASHLYIFFIGYIVFSVIICLVITKCRKTHGVNSIFSFAGNFICILSFVYVAVIYAIPYVIVKGGNFWGFFEFMLVMAFACGGIVVIQFFNYYHEKPILELILGIVYFAIVIMLLRNGASEINTIEDLAKIYNTDVSTVFKILFGFAI